MLISFFICQDEHSYLCTICG